MYWLSEEDSKMKKIFEEPLAEIIQVSDILRPEEGEENDPA